VQQFGRSADSPTPRKDYDRRVKIVREQNINPE
jgi:hypothetical protein